MPQSGQREKPASLGILVMVGILILVVLVAMAYISYNTVQRGQEEELSVEEISFMDDHNDLTSPYALSDAQLQEIADQGDNAFSYFSYQQGEVLLPTPDELLNNDQLKLTVDQRSQIEQVRSNTATAASKLAQEILQKESDLEANLLLSQPDQTMISSLAEESGDLFGQLRATTLKGYMQVIDILNKQQLLLLNE